MNNLSFPFSQRIILQNERCVLKPFTEEDVTLNYVDWLNDPESNCFLESRFIIHTPDKVLSEVRHWIANKNIFFYTIRCPNSNIHIGNIKLGPINHFHKTADIGYLIGDKSFRGKGIATAALSLLTQYAFSLGVVKVTAGAYELNISSIKVMQRAGFSLECFHPSHVIFEDKRIGCVIYSKFSEKT